MKRKTATAFLGVIMAATILAGCGGAESSGSDTTGSGGGSNPEDGEELTELTLFIDTSTTMGGFEKVAELAEKEIGIKIKVETHPSGYDGDNLIKTRLASGDMPDLIGYNSGALLKALNPSEYFIDISGEDFAQNLDDTYKSAVSVNGETYGIPFSSTQAGAVVYNKEMYEKYDLEVPKTWDEFLENCDVLKENGETAVLGTFADSWTSQVTFLGDCYNLLEGAPEFIEELEAGKAKFASTPAALRGFENTADLTEYFNADYLAATYDDGCDIMANGEAAHWIILTQSLSNIYELYGDDVNKLGVFGIPGDDADNAGLTLWMPTSIYGNKNSDNQEAILKFMEFYTSEEALDAYTSAILPDGPYCIKGYELPEEAYDAVSEDMQAFVDAGKTHVAMEFLTSVKGANCYQICQELGSGQTTAEEAAAKYDEDCAKQAKQLGLDW